MHSLDQTMIELAYRQFSSNSEELVQVCLIRIGTQLCRAVALQDWI